MVTSHLQARGLHGALHTLGCLAEGPASVPGLRALLSDLEQQEQPQVRKGWDPEPNLTTSFG